MSSHTHGEGNVMLVLVVVGIAVLELLDDDEDVEDDVDVVVGRDVELDDDDVDVVVGLEVVVDDEVEVVVGGGAQPRTRKFTSSLWSVLVLPVVIWTLWEPPAGRTTTKPPGRLMSCTV
jgi:hypothetical protein